MAQSEVTMEVKVDLEMVNCPIEVLVEKCQQWGRDRMIIQNGRLDTQALKLCEEATETLIAARKVYRLQQEAVDHTGVTAQRDDQSKMYLEELADGIGDTIVVLAQLCAMTGLDMRTCLQGAYDTIKDRKGFLNADGVFVKEMT
mgnify:FL=1